MIPILFYYLVLPFILSFALIWFLRRFGGPRVPREIQELWARDPIEKRFFRALRVTGNFGRPDAALTKLGDFESQQEAVDAVYQARDTDRKAAEPSPAAIYVVLNDRGETIEQI